MHKFEKFLEKRWAANILTVCVGVILYLLLTHFYVITDSIHWIFKILSPLITGVVMAYLMDPIAKWLETTVFIKMKNEKHRRSLSVVFAVILVLLAVILFFIALVPSQLSSFMKLVTNMSVYMNKTEALLEKLNSHGIGLNLDLSSITTYIEDKITALMDYIAQNIDTILSASKSVGTYLFNIVISFILGIYFLMGKKELLSSLDALRRAVLSAETIVAHNKFFSRCHEILLRYIGYNLLDGLAVGIVNAIVMLILRMPYVALISVVVGTTNLLPSFGPMIGGAIGAFILLLYKPIYAVWFLIFTVIIQTCDGYVLKPKLFGGSLGIPAVWTLISIIIGGKLFGVIGIFLAVPFMGIIMFSYKENFLPWLRLKRLQRAKEDRNKNNRQTPSTDKKN